MPPIVRGGDSAGTGIGRQDGTPFAGRLIDEFTVGSLIVRRETLAAVLVAGFE
jgi:hypothetical protein